MPAFDHPDYELKGSLGKGGQAIVYHARHVPLDRSVAVKVLRHADDEEIAQRLLREARLIAGIKHPNLVQIFNVGTLEDGRPYIVMECVQGGTLSQRMRIEPFTVKEAVGAIRQVASALGAAHAMGIVHRDIKPSNILLEPGDELWPKLADFGVARPEASEITEVGTAMGTPAYMAPECFRGEVSAASDVYALGLILYELVVGKRPFVAKQAYEWMVVHMEEEPVFPDDLPISSALREIITSMLAKDPADRPADGHAVEAALAALGDDVGPTLALGDLGDASPVPEHTEETTASVRTGLVAVGVGTVGLASIGLGFLAAGLVAVGLAVFAGSSASSPQPTSAEVEDAEPAEVEAAAAPRPAEASPPAHTPPDEPDDDAEPDAATPDDEPATTDDAGAAGAAPAEPASEAPASAIDDEPPRPAEAPEEQPEPGPDDGEAPAVADAAPGRHWRPHRRRARRRRPGPRRGPSAARRPHPRRRCAGAAQRLVHRHRPGPNRHPARLRPCRRCAGGAGAVDGSQDRGGHAARGRDPARRWLRHMEPRCRGVRRPVGPPGHAVGRHGRRPPDVPRPRQGPTAGHPMIPWLISVAWAGGGPWTLDAGASNLYLGLEHARYASVRTARGVRDLDGGLTAISATGVATLGLFEGAEFEAIVPFSRVRHQRPDGDLCAGPNRPADWCDVTTSLANVQLAVKGRLLDEAALNPVSISVAGLVRSGEAYSEKRGRLTALGEGQTDVGAQVSVGRTASAMGAGWYRASATVGYWYRLPLDTSDGKVPADDLVAATSMVVSPVKRLGIGPIANLFHRLGGDDLGESLNLTDPNGFAALAASQLKVGGQVALYGDHGLTVTADLLATVWARNNPSDAVGIGVGIGWYRPRGGRDDDSS